MKFSSVILLTLALFYGLSACSGEASTNQGGAEPEIAELLALADQAATLAKEVAEDAVLRQLDRGRDQVRWSFRFTDAAATRVVTVTVPAEDVPIEEWEVSTGISPLTGNQSLGLFLDGLQIGPATVVKAATQHWSGCPLRGLSLIGAEHQLVWYVFCNLPEGVVSGTMDGQSGVFTPSLAPPAIVPPTATPG